MWRIYQAIKQGKKKKKNNSISIIDTYPFMNLVWQKNDKVTSIKQIHTCIRNLNKKSSKFIWVKAQCHNPSEALSIVYKEVHINHYHETHYHHMWLELNILCCMLPNEVMIMKSHRCQKFSKAIQNIR
jgi:hypothetical protein